MISPVTCVCMMVAAGSGLYLYQEKHQTQMLDREIAKVLKQADETHERAGLLRAEYALLNDPSRLSGLATQYLPELRPTTPGQFTTLAELPKRLPAIGAPPTSNQPLEPDAPAAQLPAPLPAPDFSKPEAATPEPPKPESAKPEAAAPEPPKPEPAKPEHTKPEPAPVVAKAAPPAPHPTTFASAAVPSLPFIPSAAAAPTHPVTPAAFHSAVPLRAPTQLAPTPLTPQPVAAPRPPPPAVAAHRDLPPLQVAHAVAHAPAPVMQAAATAPAPTPVMAAASVPAAPMVGSALGMARSMAAARPIPSYGTQP